MVVETVEKMDVQGWHAIALARDVQFPRLHTLRVGATRAVVHTITSRAPRLRNLDTYTDRACDALDDACAAGLRRLAIDRIGRDGPGDLSRPTGVRAISLGFLWEEQLDEAVLAQLPASVVTCRLLPDSDTDIIAIMAELLDDPSYLPKLKHLDIEHDMDLSNVDIDDEGMAQWESTSRRLAEIGERRGFTIDLGEAPFSDEFSSGCQPWPVDFPGARL